MSGGPSRKPPYPIVATVAIPSAPRSGRLAACAHRGREDHRDTGPPRSGTREGPDQSRGADRRRGRRDRRPHPPSRTAPARPRCSIVVVPANRLTAIATENAAKPAAATACPLAAVVVQVQREPVRRGTLDAGRAQRDDADEDQPAGEQDPLPLGVPRAGASSRASGRNHRSATEHPDRDDDRHQGEVHPERQADGCSHRAQPRPDEPAQAPAAVVARHQVAPDRTVDAGGLHVHRHVPRAVAGPEHQQTRSRSPTASAGTRARRASRRTAPASPRRCADCRTARTGVPSTASPAASPRPASAVRCRAGPGRRAGGPWWRGGGPPTRPSGRRSARRPRRSRGRTAQLRAGRRSGLRGRAGHAVQCDISAPERR